MSFYIKTTMRLQSAPLDFVCCKDEIVLIDASYTLYIFSSKTHKNISRISLLGKNEKNLHPYSKMASLSNKLDVSVGIEGKSKTTLIYKNSDSFAKRGSVGINEQTVVANLLSRDGRYFASANESGEVGVFDSSNLHMLCYFEKRQDFVCSLSFSKSSNYIFMSYFDKTAMIFDIYNQNEIDMFDTASVVEQAVFIESKNLCVYATREGHIGVYDYENRVKLKEEKHCNEWASAISCEESGEFIFMGSREGVFLVYSALHNTVLFSHKFDSCGGVTKIAVCNDEILVGFVSGDVYVIDMHYLKDELDSYLLSKEFDKTVPLFDKNTALMFIPSVLRKLTEGYEENKQKILGLLAKHQTAEAYELVKPFLRVKSVSDEFDFFASQTAEIVSFMDMIEKKDFTEAYKIAYKNEVIRKLYIFESLEREFKQRVEKALSLLEDSIGNKAKALELVKPFAKIPQKYETIEQIFKNFDKFGASKELARQKKFVEYFDICDRYPFLKSTDMFKKVIAVGEGVLIKAQEYENGGALNEALKYLNILLNFEPFALRAREKMGELNNRLTLLELCAEFDKNEAVALRIYAIALQNPPMQHTAEFIGVHAKIKNKMDLYEKNIKNTTPGELLESFGELIKNELLRGSFDRLMKSAYLSQIRENAEKKDINWHKVFERFSDSFTIEPDAERLMLSLGVKNEFKAGQNKKYIYPLDIVVFGKGES